MWPSRAYLASYRDALHRGWSPDNVRGDTARREELGKIEADADAFLAGLVDREARGGPITFPDGTTVQRLPGYRRWMWDGGFVGTIGLRWQPGTDALPPHVLGHIGYAVVPWRRGRGYATAALRLLLPEARAEGLTQVELTVEPHNLASRHVIEENGGIFVEAFVAPEAYGHKHGLRYRIPLDPPPGR
ncbi:MAG TPA: GNAT family N-acetyltransferase [Vicinamibacterales bacterium]|nr:GNAT family N-acetyltransferase [Vicinamibacterales bacterium]